MVLKHKDYVADSEDEELWAALEETANEDYAQLARIVASSIVKHLGLDVETGKYLFKSGSWMDLGPRADLGAVYEDWNSTPLRPGAANSRKHDPTIKQIILREWLPPSERNNKKPGTQKKASSRRASTKGKESRGKTVKVVKPPKKQ